MIQLLPIAIAALLLSSLSVPVSANDSVSDDVREFIDEMHRDYEFDPDQLRKLLSRAETRQSILDAISRPAERVVPWHEYRQQFTTERRIREGVDFRKAHRDRLLAIGDPQLANTVVGILGVETFYGRITGKFRVIDALTTLAFHYPPRADFFRDELRQFLLLTREEAVDPLTALGSYAGAMGSPQFIASSYRKYAVDADGDGRRDLWSNWDDVIGSVAAYLRAFGWQTGAPVVVPATIADGDISRFNAGKIELNETVQSLRDKGAQFETSATPDTPAMLIVAAGKEGPEYRVGFGNFYTITRYNRSSMYSMAVYDLGQAVAAAETSP